MCRNSGVEGNGEDRLRCSYPIWECLGRFDHWFYSWLLLLANQWWQGDAMAGHVENTDRVPISWFSLRCHSWSYIGWSLFVCQLSPRKRNLHKIQRPKNTYSRHFLRLHMCVSNNIILKSKILMLKCHWVPLYVMCAMS